MNLSTEGIDRLRDKIEAARIVMAIESKDLGMRCREFRQDRHSLSLRRCARAMGISAMYLSDLELGRRVWSSDLLDRFKDACAKKGKL